MPASFACCMKGVQLHSKTQRPRYQQGSLFFYQPGNLRLSFAGPFGFLFRRGQIFQIHSFFFGGWLWTGILLWIKRGFIASTGARKQRVFSAPKELWNISYTSSYDTNSIAFLQNVVRPGLFPFPWAAWPTKSWEDSGKSSEPMNSKRNTDIMPMDLHFCLNP